MSTLTPQEQTRLKMVADKIKNGPADAKYRIYGYADQQTGTKAGTAGWPRTVPRGSTTSSFRRV